MRLAPISAAGRYLRDVAPAQAGLHGAHQAAGHHGSHSCSARLLMHLNPPSSVADYSHFIAEIVIRTTIDRSTVIVWSDSPYTGIAEGEIFVLNGFRRRLREELDFDTNLIASYGYEVYRGEERLFWYDDFPHPELPGLASTFPHHKQYRPTQDIIEFRCLR